MTGEPLAEPTPLGLVAKFLVLIILVGVALLWVIGVYAYTTLPERIPTHFNIRGEPDAYGSRSTFLILPPAFTIAPAIILAITLLRFRLVNKHPYLVNLPAFYTRITKLPRHMRGEWINKYFETILAVGVAITLLMLSLEIGIYQGAVNNELPPWLLPATITTPIIITTLLILRIRKLEKEMKNQITQQQ